MTFTTGATDCCHGLIECTQNWYTHSPICGKMKESFSITLTAELSLYKFLTLKLDNFERYSIITVQLVRSGVKQLRQWHVMSCFFTDHSVHTI